MALSILPTPTELATLQDVASVRAWVGCAEAVWDAASELLGTVPTLRILACTPAPLFKQMLETVRIPQAAVGGAAQPPREPTAVESIQLALMWRVARLAFQLDDIDLLSPAVLAPPCVGTPGSTSGTTESKAKKVKIALFADQMDENEVEIMSREQLDECYRVYRNVTGADPQPEADPTIEQVTAVRAKVTIRDEPPYVDFSVMRPFGKEMQKALKARSWLLQEDGGWKAFDVPGPPNHTVWLQSWRVFRTIMLMLHHRPDPTTGNSLPVMAIAALEEYADRIAELVREFPECWHLIWSADDRCRRDELERIRRALTRARLEGRLPMNITFEVSQPWVGCLTQAARDSEFWAKHVIRPAQTFLARSGTRKNMSAEQASEIAVEQTKVTHGLSDKTSPPGMGQSSNARKRRAKWRKDDEDKRSAKSSPSWSMSAAWSAGKKSAKTVEHPRKYGQLFVTSREGEELCFKFSKGPQGACPEPCPDGRVHLCQYCRQPHPNSLCPKKPPSSKGSNKGQGK